MHSQLFATLAAGVLAISVLPAAVFFTAFPAAAAPPARASAAASFTSHDKSGCIASEVSVFVHRDSDHRERLQLRILKADECNDHAMVNIDAEVGLPAGALRVAPDLSFAALNTAVRVTDRHTRGTVTVTVRLTWKAAEKTVVARRNDEPRGQGKFIRLKQSASLSMRMANASGVVSLPAINITLQAAESAWVGTAEGGVAMDP